MTICAGSYLASSTKLLVVLGAGEAVLGVKVAILLLHCSVCIQNVFLSSLIGVSSVLKCCRSVTCVGCKGGGATFYNMWKEHT